MSKRNQIIGAEIVSNKSFVITTSHFTVSITFKDDVMYDVSRGTSRRIDSFINFDYSVIAKTSYATRFQIKKFLCKFVRDAIKYKLTQFKEKQNG